MFCWIPGKSCHPRHGVAHHVHITVVTYCNSNLWSPSTALSLAIRKWHTATEMPSPWPTINLLWESKCWPQQGLNTTHLLPHWQALTSATQGFPFSGLNTYGIRPWRTWYIEERTSWEAGNHSVGQVVAFYEASLFALVLTKRSCPEPAY